MALGAHGHIFCAGLRFDGFYKTLLGQNEEVSRDEPVEGKEGVVQNPVLDVGTKSLHCRKTTGNHSRLKRIGQTLMHEIAVHF